MPRAAPAAGIRLFARRCWKRPATRSISSTRQLEDSSLDEVRERVRAFRPDFTVVTTAPSYLFWRCAPPELRVPQEMVRAIRDVGGTLVAVGPHASTTPRATLRKLGADVVVMGECEEMLPRLAGDWSSVDSICYRVDGDRVQGGPTPADMAELPALHWPRETIARHRHHHHRFEAPPQGPGAEMETSRGCPYHCTFCAKDNFRNIFRRRPLDGDRGGTGRPDCATASSTSTSSTRSFLPIAMCSRLIASGDIKFGIQTRIDLWSEEMLDLLGDAGCVSIEAGVESITEDGRAPPGQEMQDLDRARSATG